MTYQEYGKKNSDVIILLHGGGLSWWNYREAAELLQDRFHIIIPVLNGHANSGKDFTTIEQNASDLIAFIDECFDGQVLFIGGLSLGGQILLEMLSQRGNLCKYAIVESSLVVPSRFTHSMIKPAFGSCYGLIQYKWFSKLQFKSLHIQAALFDDYYRDTCAISKKNMISFLQANSLYQLKDSIANCSSVVRVYVGSRENRVMHISSKKIHEKLRNSSLVVLQKMNHGEFSINNPNAYAKALCELVNQ